MGLDIYLWCILCGGVIDQESDSQMFKERTHCKEYKESSGHLVVNASELEQCCFSDDERQWSGFHRMILHVPSTGIYYVSGIGYQAYTREYGLSCFRVPTDKRKAFIGCVHADADGCRAYDCSYIPPGCPMPGSVIGIPIHMRCWSLAKIKIGTEVEQNLGLFWRILQNRFRQFLGKLPLPEPISETEPFIIPGVVRAIHTSLDRKQTSHPSRNSQAPHCQLSCLPQEIYWLILDYLDRESFCNLREAVGWPDMQGYWRCRAGLLLDSDLDEAINEVKGQNIDWEYLCLELERLDEVDHAFRNRRRILGILEDRKADLLRTITGKNGSR